MKPKRLIIELVVLVAIYLVSFFCWYVIFSQFYSSSPLAIPNETYAITRQSPPQIFVFLTACVIGTIVYFVRAAVNRYKSNVTNFILLTCNCFSVVALCLLGIFLE